MAETELWQAEPSVLEIAAPGSPTEPTSTNEEGEEANKATKSSSIFSWMKEALPGKGVLAKVAEKARSSMDTMITTLDPQMKEYISMSSSFSIKKKSI